MNLNTHSWQSFYLKDLYDIQMGNGFDKNKLDEENPEVNLVSRVSYNNGVDVKVGYVDDVEPFEAGLVTVALGVRVLLCSRRTFLHRSKCCGNEIKIRYDDKIYKYICFGLGSF